MQRNSIRRFARLSAAVALLVLAAAPAKADALAKAVLIGMFDNPVFVAAAPSQPRLLFVVEQSGRIQVLRDEMKLANPFLDISNLVTFGGEQGLLSMAFAPDYKTSGLFYVCYNNRNGDVQIDEFQRASNVRADKSSRRKLLIVPHPGASNHNGGQLQFGPDGFLYISIGDGGNLSPPGDPARDLTDLRGKILRIDTHPDAGRPYSIPRGNPYLGTRNRHEIYAYGFRNPWRFSFDGNRIAIADVGQSSREEVDFLFTRDASGVNFGWPQYEGNIVFDSSRPGPDPAVFPMFTYDHSAGRCAIIGGYVAHDPTIPALSGRYLYGDACGGVIRSFQPVVSTQKAHTDAPIGITATSLSGFGVTAAGKLYITQTSGEVSRIDPP